MPIGWQAIIWTNAQPVHWRIYVAQGTISKGIIFHSMIVVTKLLEHCFDDESTVIKILFCNWYAHLYVSSVVFININHNFLNRFISKCRFIIHIYTIRDPLWNDLQVNVTVGRLGSFMPLSPWKLRRCIQISSTLRASSTQNASLWNLPRQLSGFNPAVDYTWGL